MQPLRILDQSDLAKSFFISRRRISIFGGQSNIIKREISKLKKLHGEKIAIFNRIGWPKEPDEEIRQALFAGKIVFIIHQKNSQFLGSFAIGYSRYLPSALNIEPELEGPIRV